MLITIDDGLFGFLWDDPETNNCNSYLLTGSKNVLIDPGHELYSGHVLQGLDSLGLSRADIDLVLITHGHPDHFEASAGLAPQAMLAMSRLEFELLAESGRAASLPAPDFFLTDGGLHIGDIYLDVLRTPGHSPGHLCFYWPLQRALLSGDLLFNMGFGRTDLPGGSQKQLKASLLRLKNLDIESVLPGHGQLVCGKEAVEDNFRMLEGWLQPSS